MPETVPVIPCMMSPYTCPYLDTRGYGYGCRYGTCHTVCGYGIPCMDTCTPPCRGLDGYIYKPVQEDTRDGVEIPHLRTCLGMHTPTTPQYLASPASWVRPTGRSPVPVLYLLVHAIGLYKGIGLVLRHTGWDQRRRRMQCCSLWLQCCGPRIPQPHQTSDLRSGGDTTPLDLVVLRW